MVFFAQKTPVFGPKNRLRIWGVPPSPPLRTKFSAKRELRILGVPPHSEPIAQSEPGPGHNLIGVSAADYLSKISVLGIIAIKIHFLRKIFDGIL